MEEFRVVIALNKLRETQRQYFETLLNVEERNAATIYYTHMASGNVFREGLSEVSHYIEMELNELEGENGWFRFRWDEHRVVR